ncbi:MAG: carbamoyltransferase HypF, partial [Solirubrobacteraceae bacterium]
MNVVARARLRVRVTGTVQGVGFRPYVYRLAGELSLAGFVLNDAHGVLIEVEGDAVAIDRFLARLPGEAPPLAVVEQVLAEERVPCGEGSFAIRESVGGSVPDAPVTPDTATCEDCLRELFNPADRRFRYPFINCTNCGPRFTIVRGVPYDRPLTTMASFTMCPACRAEYDDPADRRFHAQPNACANCGPSLRLLSGDGASIPGDPLPAVAAVLRAGAIVAIKGIGGYHLACLAGDEQAVASLRTRKHREDKPFALMAPSLATAETLVSLSSPSLRLLTSPARPIVLAPRLKGGPVAHAVAPGAPELGVMLPYSPLHHLLLADVGETLVMTSANVSDEPIAFVDDDAVERLRGIADLFLVHDRPIQTRTDDSVVRARTILRRSRGYVPAALLLPGGGTPRPLLACGAELKNTFCLARGSRAWVSHHIGDLENYETLRSFTDGIGHFGALFAVEPEVVAHDLHPEYLSTKYALELDGVELIGVQHHHAHLAACLAEHHETGPALGAIFDGTGYGLDGTVWGGELLLGDVGSFRRLGSLLPVALPGGERAIRQPWRMACSWLSAALDGGEPGLPASLAGRVDPRAWAQVHRLAVGG